MVFGFGLGFDAIKAATGQQLKGTMTVTGVVQEDGLTLSVKDPNKGKHVVYSLTDLGVDPTGWSYGGRLNTYWSKDEDSGDYSIIAVIPEKEASRIQGLEDAIRMTGYFSIIVIGLLIFLFDVENIPHGIFHFIGEWRSFVQKTRSTRCIQDIIQKRHLLPMEMSMLILFAAVCSYTVNGDGKEEKETRNRNRSCFSISYYGCYHSSNLSGNHYSVNC